MQKKVEFERGFSIEDMTIGQLMATGKPECYIVIVGSIPTKASAFSLNHSYLCGVPEETCLGHIEISGGHSFSSDCMRAYSIYKAITPVIEKVRGVEMNFVHWGTNNKYHAVLLSPFNMKTNYVVWDAIMEFDAGLKLKSKINVNDIQTLTCFYDLRNK